MTLCSLALPAAILASAALLAVFGLWHLLLAAVLLGRGERGVARGEGPVRVSVVLAVYNCESFVAGRIENLLGLRWPSPWREIIIWDDGSTDGTGEIVAAFGDREGVKVFSSAQNGGKISALNEAVKECGGDVVLFTDADALFDREAVLRLTENFADREVGGVCGRIVIGEEEDSFRGAQASYLRFDERLKIMESSLGSISANTGKIYAVRREYCTAIPPAVADDMYMMMTVVRQGGRFVYEPRATARIRMPARDPAHEVERRRRIVSISLRGIYLNRTVLNPFRYGIFAGSLFVNKVLRRLLPVLAPFALLCWTVLGFCYRPLLPAVAVLDAVAAAVVLFLLACRAGGGVPGGRAGRIIHYVALGFYGSFLGLLDFLAGRKVVKWRPRKS